MDWFRMYSEFASDPKVQSMSEAMQRRLMMLLCLRCSNTLVTLQDDEIAFALRISEEDLAQTKVLFLRKGFIDAEWEIMNWDKRQFISDSSAARVAKHRAAKKVASLPPENSVETPCNVTVTPQNRTDTEQNILETETPLPPEKPGGVTAVDLSIAMRKAGVNTQPADPRLIALAEQGVTPETAIAACDQAKQSKPGEKLNLGYVLAILERWAKEASELKANGAAAPKKGAGRWWASAETMFAKADEVGVKSIPGEHSDTFQARIQAAIDNGGKPPAQKPGPVIVIREEVATRNMSIEAQAQRSAALKAATRRTA